MADDIKNWLNSTIEESQNLSEYWNNRELDDPDGWGALLAPYFQSGNSVSGQGILLIGGDNYSKQTVALQVLKLLTPEAFEGIFLDGDDLSADGFAQARKRLDGLFDHFYDKGMGLCLIIDGLEDCTCRRKILNFLGQTLCVYRMNSDYTPLFLILMDEHEHDIPVLLRDSLQLCRLQLPNKDKRTAYLYNHAQSLRSYLSLEVFAQNTEGVSYIQLQNLISLAEHYVDSLDGRGLSEEELKTFLVGQMPNPAAEYPLQALCKSVQELVEQLPKLAINRIAVTNGHIMQPQAQTKPTVNQPAQPTREEIENMPPPQLFMEVLGENGVSEIQQKAAMLLTQ